MKRTLTVLALLAACLSAAGTARAEEPGGAAAATELRRGKILWLQCAACHDLENRPRESSADGKLGKIGPNLYQVFGRRAGSLKGFPYSDALKNAGLTWNPVSLDQWLREPAAVVPGTLMVFPGISNAADRLALLRYLEEATR